MSSTVESQVFLDGAALVLQSVAAIDGRETRRMVSCSLLISSSGP